MRGIRALGLALLVIGTSMSIASEALAKAMCVVCQVKHGESEPEDVKAVRSYQGKEYSFCSEKCAKEFDADPAAFVTVTE